MCGKLKDINQIVYAWLLPNDMMATVIGHDYLCMLLSNKNGIGYLLGCIASVYYI